MIRLVRLISTNALRFSAALSTAGAQTVTESIVLLLCRFRAGTRGRNGPRAPAGARANREQKARRSRYAASGRQKCF